MQAIARPCGGPARRCCSISWRSRPTRRPRATWTRELDGFARGSGPCRVSTRWCRASRTRSCVARGYRDLAGAALRASRRVSQASRAHSRMRCAGFARASELRAPGASERATGGRDHGARTAAFASAEHPARRDRSRALDEDLVAELPPLLARLVDGARRAGRSRRADLPAELARAGWIRAARSSSRSRRARTSTITPRPRASCRRVRAVVGTRRACPSSTPKRRKTVVRVVQARVLLCVYHGDGARDPACDRARCLDVAARARAGRVRGRRRLAAVTVWLGHSVQFRQYHRVAAATSVSASTTAFISFTACAPSRRSRAGSLRRARRGPCSPAA